MFDKFNYLKKRRKQLTAFLYNKYKYQKMINYNLNNVNNSFFIY